MKHPIATTHNDKEVYVDLVNSLAGTTIAQQPHLAMLVKEVLGQTRVDTETMSIEQDMQRPIGYDSVVETSSNDTIFWGKILRDPVYTRFVKNGKPLATSYLSLVLCRDGNGYELKDVWVGKQRPARPGSEDETPEGLLFWETHAFALEGQQVQPRTLTRTCPYGPEAEAAAVVAAEAKAAAAEAKAQADANAALSADTEDEAAAEATADVPANTKAA